MTETTRFGLSYFDDSNEGSISDDGGKYTGSDRLLIDSLLTAIEQHTHALNPSDLVVPVESPGLTLGNSGVLSAGEDYYYKIAFVNSDGLETLASTEASVSTPDILEPPDAPALVSDTTGTLTTGTYDYALTAVRQDEESVLGEISTIQLITGENAVTITVPALGDADSYSIWRMKSTESGFTRLDSELPPGDYTDDGSVSPQTCPLDPAYAPPTSNSGIDNLSVTVALTGDDITAVQDFVGWRIYRTTVSGDYSAQSLVAYVTERVDEVDPESDLVTSYIDEGDALVTGTPKDKDPRMTFQPLTVSYGTPLPSAGLYPEGALFWETTDLTLYVKGTSDWETAVLAGTTEGTFAAGDDSRIVGALQASNNLSDLTDTEAALGNLGIENELEPLTMIRSTETTIDAYEPTTITVAEDVLCVVTVTPLHITGAVTGFVQLYVDTTPVEDSTLLDNGAAGIYINGSTLGVGVHDVFAVYTPAAETPWLTSDSASVTITITGA